MDRHDATTAFVEAGVEGSDAEKLGQAVELLASVPSARYLVEASTVAIDNESVADLSEPISDDDKPLLEEAEIVEKPEPKKPAPGAKSGKK